MIINAAALEAVNIGFKTNFRQGVESAATAYNRICMVVPSSQREEVYGWLGQFPSVREWIGPRVLKNLATHDFSIKNRDFENTVTVPRNDIMDDRYGIFGPIMREMGKAAAEHPDQLVFALLKAGFTTLCYDGQNFFDTDHPVGTNGGDYPIRSVSNVQEGDGTPWFLLDTSRAIKPMLYQERMKYQFVSKDRPSDDNVFFLKEYIYGCDGRSNVGFGLWQLAFASKAELNAENYEAARAAMMSLTGDEGRPLGIKPDTLVVPLSLEGAAMRLLNNGSRIEIVGDVPVPVQNEWQNTAKPIITAWAA